MKVKDGPKKRTSTLFLRGIPKDLHDLFKAYCARRATTMMDAVCMFMQQCVLEDEQLLVEGIRPKNKKLKKVEKDLMTKSQIVQQRKKEIEAYTGFLKKSQDSRIKHLTNRDD